MPTSSGFGKNANKVVGDVLCKEPCPRVGLFYLNTLTSNPETHIWVIFPQAVLASRVL